jgi:membrane protein YqaA with SNARE-associated domain
MTPKQRLFVIRVLIFLGVVLLSIYIFTLRDRAQELAKFGYPGIFLLSILSNATIFLPAPGILFVFTMGAVFNPLFVAIAAGAGAAIGELSGYLIGFSGRGVVERRDTYNKILEWMQKNRYLSYLAILFLAFIPNPLFDLAGVAAGTLKIPIFTFLLLTFMGKTLKMVVFAYLGASSIEWLFNN